MKYIPTDFQIKVIDKRIKISGLSPVALVLRNEINFDMLEAYYLLLLDAPIGIELYGFMLNELNSYIKLNDNRLQELKDMSHNDYLKTREWKTKRQILVRLYGHCMLCSSYETIFHVHHNSYSSKPLEGIADLIVLCEYCHEQYHRDEQQLRQYAKQMMSWINRV
ncbi:MAG: hypothetical protein UY48_C0001G0045 [Candidatus Gottesmanbacteria bacterium GW2011_GWB1_49_7]|uniref:HNH domain-containing protein n=1 Tax=Candidatus Gottesmanbacteria bacterium GW2011_GWB1_49_7 TaxID=1618448 RepID=A0A0G1Z3Q2_9BACT|nr:MAG: hypothetical protein UY48_C0001G0045 [Candidatus Gottesmanbacteria bacterium GW2011_GWB1_49_7]